MSDQTSNAPLPRTKRTPSAEYWVYFSVILMATLPLEAISSLISLVQSDREGLSQGIFRNAWSQAQTITSLIFSA